MIISNSTPLIYLAKLNKFSLILKLYKKIIIPEEVYSEVVVKGKKMNKSEVVIIEELIENGSIEVKEAGELKKDLIFLHLGEAKAINLCLKNRLKDILIDDKEAYELCKLLNLNPIRTTAFLLMAVKNKLINKVDFRESLVKLSKEGYFMSAEVFQILIDAVVRC